MNTATLKQRMDAADGRPSGFDYMRVVLSFAVLVAHALDNGGGKEFSGMVVWGTPGLDAAVLSILPMFFALSGFLVAGSLYRCKTLISFMGLRFVRIYPALAVEVALTGLLLGPLVTTLPLQDYFTSDGFFRYLMNVTGHTTVLLPGAFADNPQPHIANGQLWTVPWELLCYIALGTAALLGGRRWRMLLLLGALLTAGAALMHHAIASDWTFRPYDGAMAGRLLVLAFMAGVVLYAYRDVVPVGPVWLAGTTVVAGWLLSTTFMGQYVAVLLVAYVTCALGVMNPRRIGLLRHADLSYGVFLYHYIVQQTLMHFFPDLRTWYWCLLTSLPLSVGVAALSWYLVEQPVMRRKGVVFRVEAAVLRGWAALRRGRTAPAPR